MNFVKERRVVDTCAFSHLATSGSHAQELNATLETMRWAQVFALDSVPWATLSAAQLSRDCQQIDPDAHCGWRRMPAAACPQRSLKQIAIFSQRK